MRRINYVSVHVTSYPRQLNLAILSG